MHMLARVADGDAMTFVVYLVEVPSGGCRVEDGQRECLIRLDDEDGAARHRQTFVVLLLNKQTHASAKPNQSAKQSHPIQTHAT